MNLLVERDEQRLTLENLFNDCLRGAQRVALVRGAVATGKTSFLDFFSSGLTDSDAVLMSVLASRRECGVPLMMLEQLLDCLWLISGGTDQCTNELFDQLRRTVSNCWDIKSFGHMTIPLHRRIRNVLHDLAGQRPIVLCIDDVHHADAASLECILYLIRRLKSARLLVILSESSFTHHRHPAFRAELLSNTTCARIELKPLSVRGVKAVLADALGSDTATQLTPTLHRISGGNPLLLRALIDDHLAVADTVPAEAVIDESFRQAVVDCLYRCDTTTASIARALAIVGESATPALLGRLVNIDVDSATRCLRALNDFGLLDSGRFRCTESVTAALSDMAVAERGVLHNRAARLLYNEGAAAPVVAKHLVSANSITMPWAIPVLQDAAERGLLHGDLDLPIACLQLAEKLCTDEQRQSGVHTASARAQWQVNPCAVDRRLPKLLEVAREGRLDNRQVTTVLGYLLWHGHTADAVDIFERMVEAHTDPSSQHEPEIEIAQLWLSYTYPKLFDNRLCGEPTPTHRNLRRGPQIDTHLRAARVLASVLTRGPSACTRVKAERILQATHLTDTTLAPVVCALTSLIYAEDLETAASWCTLFLDEATTRGVPFWRAVLECVASTVSIRQGNQRTARDHARSALTLLTYESWGIAIGVPVASFVSATTAMGRYPEAAAYLAIPVPDIMFDTPVGLHYLQARGRYLLAIDRCHAALDDFERCGRLMTSWDMDVPTLVPWRTEAAQIYLRMGDNARAQELAQTQLSRLRSGDSVTRGLSMRILAATQDFPRRLSTLREAADMLENCGDRLELARVLADLSRTHQSIGQHGVARIHARRALRLARECGADAIRWTMLPDLAAVDAGVSNRVSTDLDRITELSDAERRVATLAAEGYTNRQMAKRLFITISTVEQHMTRIYRKLGVTRRAELVSVLDEALTGATGNSKKNTS